MNAEFVHEPVMLEEVMAWLIVNPSGVYVDGTIGGAGHAKALLERTQATLIGLDCDADALSASEAKLAEFGTRKQLIKSNFAGLTAVLASLNIEKVDGILLDLGVSSYQLDTAARGFSFSRQAPLDMRMDQDLKLRAYDVVNGFSQKELEDVIRLYGEEKMASRIARTIVRRRQTAPVETTVELADLIMQAMPGSMRHQKIHPATRTFQALRIAVNRELDCIEPGIQSAVDALAKGGRLCVISFHSLEDRIVKNKIRDLAAACVCPKDIPYCICHRKASINVLTRKAVMPSLQETTHNPRARSARLRVAERI